MVKDPPALAAIGNAAFSGILGVFALRGGIPAVVGLVRGRRRVAVGVFCDSAFRGTQGALAGPLGNLGVRVGARAWSVRLFSSWSRLGGFRQRIGSRALLVAKTTLRWGLAVGCGDVGWCGRCRFIVPIPPPVPLAALALVFGFVLLT